MATGDLTNNVRKLKAKLRTIKYTEDIDLHGLTEGNAKAYLPVYHFAFTQYSSALAAMILEKDIELFGKSDSRFMESIYKILRDIFSYKPPVTKDQFFAKGFAERKVIMCTEVLQKVIAKNAALNPAPAKTSLKTSVRPASATESRNMPLGVSKTKRPVSARMSQQQQPSASQDQDASHPPLQVVNELKSEPVSPPVRHTSQSTSRGSITRHIARSPDDGSNESGDSSLLQPRRQVTIISPRIDDIHDGGRDSWDESPARPKYNLYPETPSIRHVCPNMVEVVSIPKESLSPDAHSESAIEIRATTSESILNSTVPGAESSVQTQISNLYQSMETLTEQVMRFDSTIQHLQKSSVGSTDPYIHGLEEKIQSQIDNLMARMVLLENRTSILEAKIEDRCKANTIPGQAKPNALLEVLQPSIPAPSFSEDLQSVSAAHRFQQVLKDHADLSLTYSPIRKTTNVMDGQLMTGNEDTFVQAQETEDDARRSSTPTIGLGRSLLGDSSICCNFSDPDTNDAVSRVKNMMKETKAILADQKLSSKAGTAT